MADVSASEVIGPDGDVDPDAVDRVITELDESAETAAERFAPPAEPPAEQTAEKFLQEGVGRAIGLYILLRTDDRHYRFSPDEYDRLESALRTYLELYARCYGVDTDVDVTLRTAAETLLDTDDLTDTATLLTGAPDRNG